MRPKHTVEPPANTTITQCTNCNGDLAFNPAAQTLDCAFCNSSYTLTGEPVNTETAITEAPQFIIPFAFAKEVFDKAAVEWLSQGDYTPANVLDSYHTNSTKGVYMCLSIWNINYVVADPMGNKTGSTNAFVIPKALANWPSAPVEFAQQLGLQKKAVKPFDKIFTLGFEMLEDEVEDADTFNSNAKALAVKTVIDELNLRDSKVVTITNLSLTKVYMPFWVNSFTWQDQRCEVLMSGCDVTQIDGVRPVDKEAADKKKPSFGVAIWSLLIGVVLTIAGTMMSTKTGGTGVGAFLAGLGICVLCFVFPIALIVGGIRIKMFKDPRIALAKHRAEKLSQRLAQHKL